MKKFRNLALALLILSGSVLIFFGCFYKYMIGPVSKSDKEITITIESGTNTKDIGKMLEKNKLIRNANFFYFYAKIFKIDKIQAGVYRFSPNMGVEKIIKSLEEGSSYNEDVITITFKEGINMRKFAKVVSENTNNSYESVIEYVNDLEIVNSLINEYWFLTDEIKNKDIYYTLEGYLAPNTYEFKNKDVTVDTIIRKLLNETGKVLDPYKEKIEASGYSVHQLLSLASMAELEGVSDEDRKNIASVFFNRLDKKMSLGSDVTTYYAFKVDMSERDLTSKEFNTYNPYNTRGPKMGGKIPVGPICFPSKSAIIATIDHSTTDYLYFVADKNRKVYFTRTDAEHQKMIKEIKDRGEWISW